MDYEYTPPSESCGLENEHGDPDAPELNQNVLDEFLADPEAFLNQTNFTIGSLADLDASLCYIGNTAPELVRESTIDAFPERSNNHGRV